MQFWGNFNFLPLQPSFACISNMLVSKTYAMIPYLYLCLGWDVASSQRCSYQWKGHWLGASPFISGSSPTASLSPCDLAGYNDILQVLCWFLATSFKKWVLNPLKLRENFIHINMLHLYFFPLSGLRAQEAGTQWTMLTALNFCQLSSTKKYSCFFFWHHICIFCCLLSFFYFIICLEQRVYICGVLKLSIPLLVQRARFDKNISMQMAMFNISFFLSHLCILLGFKAFINLWSLSDFMKKSGFLFGWFFVYKGYCAITLQTDSRLCD